MIPLLLFASVITGPEPIGNRVIDLTPPVSRPDTPRCVVTLFERREFAGETPLPIAYRPPAECPGPWRKVVLEADFDVTAGTQFDRTADLTLGGATLFVGTTMEPDAHYAPHWHVERDVTDVAAVLRHPAEGVAALANFIDKDHDGRVFWRARLVFYGGKQAEPYRVVLPVTGGLTRLDAQQPTFNRTLDLPRNLIRLEMDLFAIGQERDEFWYDCVPPGFAAPNPFAPTACAAPHREVEVRIDDQLAGIHAVQPVIFTGGINPSLWRRAPDLHALNLPSARLDLTPFAGLLNDGKPHRITLTMPGVGNSFRVSATLIGEVDPTRAVVPGAVIANRLAPASVTTRQIQPGRRADLTGTLLTTAERSGYVEGYIRTSRGRVTTRVAYALDAQLTSVRDTGKSDKRYEARQSMTVTNRGRKPSRHHIDEHDSLAIAIHVDPPLYGVKYGTQIIHTSERMTLGEGERDSSQTLVLKTFAPSSSVFSAPRSQPNPVSAMSLSRHPGQPCQRTEATLEDDLVTQSADTACLVPPLQTPGHPPF
ncbi:peptide-N4-asparagine amidase [Sphingomonas fuzhouensis]|uniref:peptide-N4-asparagine amidase n=1 Tax=Sphingomonas fuzhouensis TaxID=3106033 RepID=UPI002B0024F0|nr:peptide-N4-asparagine amidase [Sphingomonas sp. SGZ-02]